MIRGILYIVVVLHGTNMSQGREQKISSSDSTNSYPSYHDLFGYELIQSKLDFMEDRISQSFTQLQEIANGIQKQTETAEKQITAVVQQQKQKIITLDEAVESSLRNRVSLVKNQIAKLQTSFSENDSIMKRFIYTQLCTKPSERLPYWCLTDWIIVLQRSDGSVVFNRNWTDYRDGFGTVGQEFWLGLEKLHELTKNDSFELMFELEDFPGKYAYARYSNFSIGSEAELYPVKVLGAYSGTAGDSFSRHKGVKFAALDKGGNPGCADTFTGGWWYENCYDSHLTGNWDAHNDWTAIVWRKFGYYENTGLKYVRMMIRRL